MSRFSTVPVRSSSWSASVDLPWSMCAIMAKFRMRSGPCTAISRGLPASSGADVVAAAARAAQPQRLQGRGSAGRPDVLAAPQRSWLHAGRMVVSPACSHMLAPCCLTANCCLAGAGKLRPSESRPLGRAARTQSRSGAKYTFAWREGHSAHQQAQAPRLVYNAVMIKPLMINQSAIVALPATGLHLALPGNTIGAGKAWGRTTERRAV